MTDIRSMPAGREMDALVAERVMGWQPCGCQHNASLPFPDHWVDTETDEWMVMPHPFSTDIAAAWEVMERVKDHIEAMWWDSAEGKWGIRTDADPVPAWYASAPEAICRAALLAVENR